MQDPVAPQLNAAKRDTLPLHLFNASLAPEITAQKLAKMQ